jgi:hypothetical protein
VLFRSWASWAGVAKEPVGSQRAFSQKLEARFMKHRTEKGVGFLGLRLREEDFEW